MTEGSGKLHLKEVTFKLRRKVAMFREARNLKVGPWCQVTDFGF